MSIQARGMILSNELKSALYYLYNAFSYSHLCTKSAYSFLTHNFTTLCIFLGRGFEIGLGTEKHYGKHMCQLIQSDFQLLSSKIRFGRPIAF